MGTGQSNNSGYPFSDTNDKDKYDIKDVEVFIMDYSINMIEIAKTEDVNILFNRTWNHYHFTERIFF